jgi:hypothetical protein
VRVWVLFDVHSLQAEYVYVHAVGVGVGVVGAKAKAIAEIWVVVNTLRLFILETVAIAVDICVAVLPFFAEDANALWQLEQYVP